MSSKIVYINSQQSIEIHNWTIDNAGGFSRTKDTQCLNNILQEIKSDRNYPEFKDKLTDLIFEINKYQNLIDDSKRLSIVLGCYFLELNGYDYVVHYFAKEMENIVVWLADGRISRDLFAEIIESLIYEDEYSEELKLKIAIAIN